MSGSAAHLYSVELRSGTRTAWGPARNIVRVDDIPDLNEALTVAARMMAKHSEMEGPEAFIAVRDRGGGKRKEVFFAVYEQGWEVVVMMGRLQ